MSLCLFIPIGVRACVCMGMGVGVCMCVVCAHVCMQVHVCVCGGVVHVCVQAHVCACLVGVASPSQTPFSKATGRAREGVWCVTSRRRAAGRAHGLWDNGRGGDICLEPTKTTQAGTEAGLAGP